MFATPLLACSANRCSRSHSSCCKLGLLFAVQPLQFAVPVLLLLVQNASDEFADAICEFVAEVEEGRSKKLARSKKSSRASAT